MIVIIIFKLLQKVNSFLMNFLGFFYYHFAVVFLGILVALYASVIECFILINLQVYFWRSGNFGLLLLYLIKYWIRKTFTCAISEIWVELEHFLNKNEHLIIYFIQLSDEIKLVQALGRLFLFFRLTDAEFALIYENLLNVVSWFLFLNKKNVLIVKFCIQAANDNSHLVLLAHIILIIVLSMLIFLWYWIARITWEKNVLLLSNQSCLDIAFKVLGNVLLSFLTLLVSLQNFKKWTC